MSYSNTDRGSVVNSRTLSKHLEERIYAVPDAVLCVTGLSSPGNSSPASCPKWSLRSVLWGPPDQNASTGCQTPDTKTGQTQGAMTRPAGRRGDADSIYDKRRTVEKSLRACVSRLCVESCQIRCCVQGDRASGSRYEQSLNLQEIHTASTVQILKG